MCAADSELTFWVSYARIFFSELSSAAVSRYCFGWMLMNWEPHCNIPSLSPEGMAEYLRMISTQAHGGAWTADRILRNRARLFELKLVQPVPKTWEMS
jgi:hypothetical protein